MAPNEVDLGKTSDGKPIKLVFEGRSDSGGAVNDYLGSKYKDKDIARNGLGPAEYLEKVKGQFSSEDQTVFLTVLGEVTRIAAQAPVAHKRTVDGLSVPSELTPDFTLQLPKTEGNMPTITLSGETANSLISSMNVTRFRLQKRQESIVATARRELVEFINSGKAVTSSLPDRLRSLEQQVRMGLAKMMAGKEMTQEIVRKTAEQMVTAKSLALPMTIGFPIEVANSFLGEGDEPMDLHGPVNMAQFIASSMLFSFGMDELDIDPRVVDELRGAWTEEINKITKV
jgi:hypothetical protein